MLLEKSLFGTVDKEREAIELLQKHEPPELMQFIFKQYPEVINDHPLKTMYQLIVQYGFPPIRIVRYCCWELKANNGNNRIKVTGVRAEESPRRAKYPKVEIKENSGELRLIHDWTAAEVWEYIRARNLAYCKLYDEGKKRIGCVFCPFARERENIENALKYPQFVRYFITACGRAIKTRLAKGKDSKYKTGEEMFISWIEGGRGKKLKDFGVNFDYQKGTFVMENNVNSVVKVETSQLLKISYVDFNAIILHAKKINRGQLDFADILRTELKNKLGIDNAEPLINSLQKNKELPAHRQAFSFLAQSSNFIIEGTNTNYHLVKFSDDLGACGLNEIDKRSVDKMENHSFKSEVTTTLTTANENTTTIPAENSNAATPDTANELDALSVEQLTMEAKFYFAQMGQNAIEFGKRLIAIKKKLPHGDWQDWLKNNFSMSIRTAQRLIAVADRFGKTTPVSFLGYSQMLALVSLPAGEEERFLAAMDEKGTPFEKMTKREANSAVKDWKAEAEKKAKEVEKLKKEAEEKEAEEKEAEEKDAEIENQFAQINSLRNENVKLWEENGEAEIKANKLKKENEQLKNNPVEVEVVPPDYEAQKKEIEELKAQNLELQKQLENSTVEVLPAEDEEKENLRKELNTFKAREENFREEIATSQALNQFFMMANFLQEHKDSLPEVLKGYVETDGLTSQRINQIAFVSSLLKKILKDIS